MRRWLVQSPTQSLSRSLCVLERRPFIRSFFSTVSRLHFQQNEQELQTLKDDALRSIRKSEACTPNIHLQDEARKIRTRHLLRSLLRELTYLPDPFARKYLHAHILKRFRTYDFKAWKLHQRDDNLKARIHAKEEQALYEQRLKEKEKEARNALVLLKRANDGERKCLMRVLFWAYGRVGRRRWELMGPLMHKESKEEIERKLVREDGDQGVESLIEDGITVDELSEEEPPTGSTSPSASQPPWPISTRSLDKTSTITLVPKLSPALHALLQSQVSSSPPSLARTHLRRLTSEIPALNSWLRPMPQKRIKNKRKELHASLLEKALPPLPREEWEYLLSIASGRSSTPTIVPRRGRGRGVDGSANASGGGSAALETVLAFGKPPKRVLDRRGGHTMTPRFMRRLYRQVLGQCCFMEWDKEEEKWKVVWGEQALADLEKRRFDKVARSGSDGALNGYHDWVEWR